MLPLLLGLVSITGLGALLTCLAARFDLLTTIMVIIVIIVIIVRTVTMVTRLAFYSNAATLEHLHSLLLTTSLLLFGLGILQVYLGISWYIWIYRAQQESKTNALH